MKKIKEYAVKIPTVGSLGYAGATMLASNMPYLGDLAIPIGAGIGLGIGSVVAYAVTELEKHNQVIPIVAIGYILAHGGYKEGMKVVYENNLQYELQKSYYEYASLMEAKTKTVFNEDKYNKAYSEWQSSLKKSQKAIFDSNQDREQFIKNKDTYINKKTDWLLSVKYDKYGHRTSYYNNFITPYIRYAEKAGIILPPSGKKGTKQDRVAVEAIAKAMYQYELSQKPLSKSISTATNVSDIPFSVKKLSQDYIIKKREEIRELIDKEKAKAKEQITPLAELEKKAFWAGFIAEVILAPVFMWVDLLKRLPTPFKRREKEFKRELQPVARTEKFIDTNREETEKEIVDFTEKLKQYNIRPSLINQRVLTVALTFKNYLPAMMVFATKKKDVTSLQMFLSKDYKEKFVDTIQRGEKELAYSIQRHTVNTKLYQEIGGDFSLFPKGDSIKKSWNEAIRFLKYLSLNISIPENISNEELERNILVEYSKYKKER